MIVTNAIIMRVYKLYLLNSHRDSLSHGQLGGVWIIWCHRDRTNHVPYDWRADLVAFAPLDRDTTSNNTDAADREAATGHCHTNTRNDNLHCCGEEPEEEEG